MGDIQFRNPAYVADLIDMRSDPEVRMALGAFGRITLFAGATTADGVPIVGSNQTVLYPDGPIVATPTGGVPIRLNDIRDFNMTGTGQQGSRADPNSTTPLAI